MIFPRTKLISQFHEVFIGSNSPYTVISGESGIGKTTFVDLLKANSIFPEETTAFLYITSENPLQSQIIDSGINLVIIDSDIGLSFSDIRTFIESNSFKGRIIFTNTNDIEDTNIIDFVIPGISFREYSEGMGYTVDVGSIMSGNSNIHDYNLLRDTYIHLGQYPLNLNDTTHGDVGFHKKLTVMNSELFKKEEGDFLEFIRTVAMNVGDIFKEERIAKNMNISRRKVRKYTEIILKHHLVKAIGPWVENTDVELSRHVKVYFTDLSYFYAALGVSYYHGEGKQGVMENFILTELDRKLKTTHHIHFYRKKSGAEVSFVLVEKNTGKITPIEVTTRPSEVIPQALKSFYETYSDRIDHAMIMNDSIATRKDINGSPIIVLPHIAI